MGKIVLFFWLLLVFWLCNTVSGISALVASLFHAALSQEVMTKNII